MALEGENFFDNQYYVYNRRFLTIVGLWPYQDLYERLPYVCFIIVIMILAITLQTYILVKSEFETNQMADLMQTFLPTICFASIYCNLLYNVTETKEALNQIGKDWNKLMNEAELMIMRKYANASRLCCLSIACIFYIFIGLLIFPSVPSFFLYISGAINNTQLILPVKSEALVTNEMNYFVMFPLLVIMIITICTIGIAYYTMLLAIAQHAFALFKILTIKLDQAFIKDTDIFYRTSSNAKHKGEYECIIAVIKFHSDTINFLNLGKVFYGETYIVQVLMAILFIILDFFYFFQIIDSKVTTSEAIRNVVYIIGNLSMIYAAFYLGQRVINHSSNIYTKCLLIPFYELSIKTNILLLVLTMRCTKPCQISFGGTVVASHELFTKIIKISFSCATVFYNMR